MPQLDGTGPEGKGTGKGRKLGQCSPLTDEEKLQNLGKGVGKRRKTGGGQGKGKRLRSGLEKLGRFLSGK
jgi:hypothetical protein